MLVKPVRLLIRFYQLAISPLTGPHCRFHPTCSAYALEALEKHGFLRGSALALRRLGRCQPWSSAPYADPVPDQFAWGKVFRYKRPERAACSCGETHSHQHSNTQTE